MSVQYRVHIQALDFHGTIFLEHTGIRINKYVTRQITCVRIENEAFMRNQAKKKKSRMQIGCSQVLSEDLIPDPCAL